MSIQYLDHSEINFEKWDTCIKESANGLIYSTADFLNTMCNKWDALIIDDYRTIMPLTKRRKFGIDYLYQPAFIQQTGIIGNTDSEIVSAFISSAQHKFRFAEIHVNFLNKTKFGNPKKNQILPLEKKYDILQSNYSDYIHRKINQSKKKNIQYSELDPNINLSTYQHLLGKKTSHVTADSYNKLALYLNLKSAIRLCRGIWIDGNLAASVCGLKDHRRIYLLTLTAHDRIAFPYATHALIDKIIEEFSGQKLILDFEGSELSGVSAFNEGFGAIEQPYYFCRWNTLPWPIKLLK